MGSRMSTARPLAGAAAALLAGSVLAACAGGDDGAGACEDIAATQSEAGDPGDAPVLLLVEAPSDRLVVYADGAVARLSDDGGAAGAAPAPDVVAPATSVAPGSRAAVRAPRLAPGYPGEQPGVFEGGHLPGCWLREVTERADAVLDGEVEPGTPSITDSYSTVFEYRPVGGDVVRVSAYAFTRGDQSDQGLSRDEQRVRGALSDLWDVVDDQTVIDGPLAPTELEVRRFAPVDDGDVDWPLPPPSELFGEADCAAVTGSDVGALLDRLDDGDLLTGEPWRIAVRAQPPGLPACEG